MSKKKIKPRKKVTEEQPAAVKDSLASQEQLASRNNLMLHSIFLFVLAFITYGNTLMNNWALDDTLVILGNSFTQQGLDGLKGIWTKDMFVGAHGQEFELTGGRYRPLSLTVFAVLVEFFAKDFMTNPESKETLAFMGHLTNILFFAFSGVLVYRTLLRFMPTMNAWIPLVTAALFVVHPIHTEVVANIKSLDEIMALFFLLLSMYYMFEQDTKSRILTLAFYLLALLSKENTITALGIIPLTLVMFRKLAIKTALIRTVPYVLVAAVYLVLRENFSGGFSSGLAAKNLMDNPYIGMDLATKLATLFLIAGKYISLLLAPIDLSYDYSYNAIGWRNWGDPYVWLSFLVVVGVAVYAVKELMAYIKGQKDPTVLVYGLWFYIMAYSIVSNFVFNIGTYMGERFLYMASLGFCLVLAALLAQLLKVDLKKELPFEARWIIPVLVIVIPFSAISINRNYDWKDNYTLYEADIEKVPNSARARLFIGIEQLNQFYAYKDTAKLESAINQMTLATEIYPDFYHAYYNLGLAYQAKQDHPNAVRVFKHVLKIQPTHINTHYYIGMSYGSGLNDTQKAIEHMEKGIRYGYNGSDRYINLGVAYGMSGNLQKAAASFEQALPENQNNIQLYQNLVITYKNMGNIEKARAYAERLKVLQGK